MIDPLDDRPAHKGHPTPCAGFVLDPIGRVARHGPAWDPPDPRAQARNALAYIGITYLPDTKEHP